jgi:dolichyldiphosphatase
MNGKGYGMPSSHAQFVTFFSIYLCLFLLLRHRPHPISTHTPSTTLFERVCLSFLSLVSAAAVASSRVYLNYHTPKQVAIGCGAGAVLALAWFMATTVARRTGLLSWGLDLPLARVFRLRDLVVHEDLADAGWEKWETMRRARSMEATKKLL